MRPLSNTDCPKPQKKESHQILSCEDTRQTSRHGAEAGGSHRSHIRMACTTGEKRVGRDRRLRAASESARQKDKGVKCDNNAILFWLE